MKSIAILGRQPEISLAELEALFSADKIDCQNPEAALLDIPIDQIPFQRLGGTIKLGKVLGFVDKSNLKISLLRVLDDLKLPTEGKLNFGLSSYGLSLDSKMSIGISLSIKKHLIRQGYKIRVIPNRTASLNTAQVWHNRLTTDRGLELLLVGWGEKAIVAQTVHIQDIEAYTKRDRYRPKRDARVGMLPPKLAQIIINLAASTTATNNKIILDPFCGTGVILQEAALMGFEVIGSDISDKMIDYSKTNIEWLQTTYSMQIQANLGVVDATNSNWQRKPDIVASETYLGPALHYLPRDSQLTNIINDINLLHKQFLQNIGNQLDAGTRLCLAVPAWKVGEKFYHLPVLDQLADLGYNRVAFRHATADKLIYHRPQQLVARELITLIRK